MIWLHILQQLNTQENYICQVCYSIRREYPSSSEKATKILFQLHICEMLDFSFRL